MEENNENKNLNENTEINAAEQNGTNTETQNASAKAAETNAASGNTNEMPGGFVPQNNGFTPQGSGFEPHEDGKKYYYSWDGRQFIRHKKKTGLKVLALTVAVALIISVIGFTAALLTRNDDGAESQEASASTETGSSAEEERNETSREFVNSGTITTQSKPEDSSADSLSALYEKCSPSCCSIYLKIKTGYVLGSGFVVDAKNGYIVTNNHVIEESEGDIEAIFYDGSKYQATLVGADSLTDIAVLKIDAENLVALELGDSSQVKIGDQVIAIGTPYDLTLAGTLTNGVISGVDRSVDLTNDYGTVVKTMKLLQTNSSINPGNSGGPLLNMYGQVIGINTLKLMDEYEGLGFAIPMSYAVTVINNLIDYGEVRDDTGLVKATAKLNITVCTYPTTDDYTKETYDLPDDVPEGVLVIETTRSSAIYKAGIENYDIITEFNGTAITSYSDLSTELAKYSAGDEVTIKVYRIDRSGKGDYVTLSFKLDAAS